MRLSFHKLRVLGGPALLALLVSGLASFREVTAAPVAVRHAEGLVHGFLRLSTMSGKHLADGQMIQFAEGKRVTSRLVFHFKDGSVHDETSVFSQGRYFRLISNHLIQKGPMFKRPVEVWIDRTSGRVKVRYEDDGEQKVEEERMDLPGDLANGMINTLLKNLPPGGPPHTVSMVAATPKPRVVKITFEASGEDPFLIGGDTQRAIHYVLKIDIPGMAGVIAPLIGKKPQDSNVWILPGEAPAFVKSESLMTADGPLLRMELVSPVWPRKQPEGT